MGSPEQEDYWLERIKESLHGIDFGQVLITIHDGRIVQIERTERKRFEVEPGVPVSSSDHAKKKNSSKTSN
ncbi:MAG: putative small protein [Paenibacillaceae bacterium]|jgi:hypothetical protein|nr:putative small protein [Paenibacillaceae bacterium]